MWNVMILTVMMSVAGYYSIADQKFVMESQPSEAAALAQEMALYRQVVVDYLSDPKHSHIKDKTVDLKDLSLPYWAKQAHMSRWSNYVGDDGTIYIFAQGGLPANITQAVTKMSRNSVLAGEAVGDGATTLKLHAPADVDTKSGSGSDMDKSKGSSGATDYGSHAAIDLPMGKGIRAGSPVWLASRN